MWTRGLQATVTVIETIWSQEWRLNAKTSSRHLYVQKHWKHNNDCPESTIYCCVQDLTALQEQSNMLAFINIQT